MPSDFTQIGSDGTGYVNSPQDVVKQDLPLLQALQRAPQDDPLVRREERSLSHELASALQNMHQSALPQMSHDDMINALAMSMLHREEQRPAANPYDSLLGGQDDYRGGDMSSIFGSDDGLPGYGAGFSDGYEDGSGYGAHHHLGSGQQPFDTPFTGLYDGGRGADGSYSGRDNRGTTGAASGSQFQMNSDGTVTSPDLKQVFSGAHNGDAHPDLLHLSRQDYPGGFALNSDAKDGNTRAVNGEVDGHKVEVWTDNDGTVKAQVDGTPVDANHPDPNGILKSNSDGSYTITGRDDRTNASIDVRVGANDPNGQHRGLTTTVSNVNGPGGNPLHLGGYLGNALSGRSS